MVSLETDFTQDDKCAFSSTLITEHYSCANANNVVRRGGNEISCCNKNASEKCELVYKKLKEIAISAFEVDDDLLEMPHGVMVKIQHGGLLGINALLFSESNKNISNISKLISDCEIKFTNFNNIPYESTVSFMTSYKIRSRRK